MKLLPISDGTFAQVDDEDFERLSRFTWHLKNSVIARSTGKSSDITPNRWITISIPLGAEVIQEFISVVDHKDGNIRNNQKSNLRLASVYQNLQNRRKTSSPRTSKYKGVSWCASRNSWFVAVKCRNKSHFIGRFKNEIEAAKAYDEAALRLHKEFAVLNFPKA